MKDALTRDPGRRDSTPILLPRREFIRAVGGAGLWAAASRLSSAETPAVLRAAVIGHSGRGEYGHGLEEIFRNRPGIETVALADPDEKGRNRTGQAIEAARTYADYRELLRVEKPDLVSVCMRHADQHHAVCRAALEVGAHVYCEKPFVRFPAEADEVLKLAAALDRKVAVAHTMRMAPVVLRLRTLIQDGVLGEIVEVRAHGKQDLRAGGEDLMVLGSHLFDLFRLFLGDPLSCTARVLWRGRDITVEDRRKVKDDVGWVAGDEVNAQFEFANGLVATFSSSTRLREARGPWGIELVGTQAVARLNADMNPIAFLRNGGPWPPGGRTETWVPVAAAPGTRPVSHNAWPVDDWLKAIRSNREPECSGKNGAWAVEMVMAVYRAALTGRRVNFPLTERGHPLEA